MTNLNQMCQEYDGSARTPRDIVGLTPPSRGIYWGENAPQNDPAGPGTSLNFHYATLWYPNMENICTPHFSFMKSQIISGTNFTCRAKGIYCNSPPNLIGTCRLFMRPHSRYVSCSFCNPLMYDVIHTYDRTGGLYILHKYSVYRIPLEPKFFHLLAAKKALQFYI